MHAKEGRDLLHRVDAGGEGSRHDLAALGTAARKARERLRQGPALRARDLAQPLQGFGAGAVALGRTSLPRNT